MYLFGHKWYVFLECRAAGIGWLGIIHDLSKFLPDEFIPYVRHDWDGEKDDVGYCKPADTGDEAFDYAWLLHQKRNKHHWQWWVLPEDDGGTKVLEMPSKYRREMLCDWRGAGRAQGYGDNTKEWYQKNRDRMRLHPRTREWIEERLGIDGSGLPSQEEEEMSDEANWCCYIDPESGKGCEADAELLIVSGHSSDDATEACPLHVEDLFTDGPFNHVFPLVKGGKMEFRKLAEIMNQEFGEPFLAKGLVDAKAEDDGTFRLRIGPRDIHINDEVLVLGTGKRMDESLVLEKPVQQ